jgi:HEAT repeat protein
MKERPLDLQTLSTDAAERRRVLGELVNSGDSSAAEALTTTLLKSNWPVCDELAEALAQIGGDEAKTGLIRALKGRRHHIRSAAVKALALLGGTGVREEIARLKDDPAYEVRQDVAEALRQLGARKPGKESKS